MSRFFMVHCVYKLDNVCNNICFNSSAMDQVISHGCLRGRPFVGVAIYVKQNLALCTNLIKATDRYIIILVKDIVVVNVYLPCGNDDSVQECYMDCLANITNDISELDFRQLIFGGDLNIDFNTGHAMKDYLLNFPSDIGIVFVDDKLDSELSKSTFRVDSTGAASCIDHFAVSHSLSDNIMHVGIEDSGINLSDHCPVILDVQVPVLNFRDRPKTSKQHQDKQLCFRWDKGDVWHYYVITYDKLSTIDVPLHLLSSVASVDVASVDYGRPM